jgi:glycosyltransferase involved in cell wall biosynthesis
LVVYVHHVIRHGNYAKGTISTSTIISEYISLFFSKRANLIFVYNEEIRDSLVAMGFDFGKICLTKNAVELDYIDSIESKGTSFDACFCGALSKIKGVYDLVEVWEEIIKYHPNSRLVIIGEGEEYDNLLHIIKCKSLEKNILIEGFLEEEQKILKIKSSKLFVFPSYQEGWGIIVMEAMACGIPVVSYDLSAYGFFGGGIVKIPVGDKKQMARSIIELLVDEERRIVLANQAKEASKLVNWNDIATEEFRRINNLVSQ